MSATLPPQPPVRRYAKQHIDWTPDLVDWLYSSRAAGVPVIEIARAIGCSTQTIFAQFRRDPRGVPQMEAPPAAPVRSIADFIRLGKGMAEDMPAHVLSREIGRRRDTAPIGPLTTVPMRRPVGRALDLGGW